MIAFPTSGVPPVSGGSTLIHQLQLDSATSEPYYRQLTRQILALIQQGDLQPGASLPSERDLAEALQVSRTTVKRCYDELRGAMQLSTHGRGGTVVKGTPQLSPTLGRLKGFTEEMRELGMTPSTRVVEHQIVADRTVASIFQRPSTATFLKLVRIRYADEVPMSREVAWYDLTLAPDLALWDTAGSVYTFLKEQCRVQLANAEQSIEAVTSSAEEAAVFGFTAPSPCLLFKRRSLSEQHQLVEYVEGTFRGDAYSYRLTLRA